MFAHPRAKEVINVQRWDLKLSYFLRERYTKNLLGILLEVSLTWSTFLVIFLKIFIHTHILGCGQGGIHKKIFWVCVWISGEVCKIPDLEIHNARIEEASIKNDTRKRNDQLLSLGPEKSGLESMHPKINLVYTNVLHSSKFGLWMGRAKCKRYSWQG